MLKLTLKKQKILMNHQQVLVCNIEYLWVVQVSLIGVCDGCEDEIVSDVIYPLNYHHHLLENIISNQ